ncbi:hypothetical protein KJ885_03595 [Patescibacteria group bacterium]|nr:hypothetical protein [Patescibacteria group bacterium]
MLHVSTLSGVLGFVAVIAWFAHYFVNRTKMKGKGLEALNKQLTNRGIMVFLCVMMLVNTLCPLAGTEPMTGTAKVLLGIWLFLTPLNGWSLWVTWKEYKAVKKKG